MTSAKPFVKWAGGKSQLLAEIRAKYPQRVERYCEPFVCIDPPYRPLTQTAAFTSYNAEHLEADNHDYGFSL